MTKRRAAGSLKKPSASCQRRDEIDRQQRQDRAELDQHREGLAEVVVVEAEEVLHQQQMAGRGHRQEFGQALDDAEDERLEKVECHERLRGQRGRRFGEMRGDSGAFAAIGNARATDEVRDGTGCVDPFLHR